MRIFDLQPGARIRIKRTFSDFDGTEHIAGRELLLVDHNVFPYEDGHTLSFADGTVIRLSGNQPNNESIMDDPNDVYWELIGQESNSERSS